MQTLVSIVFDVVGWVSDFLGAALLPLTRGDSDLTAAAVIALCLWTIALCHGRLVGVRKSESNGGILRRVLVCLLVYAAVLQAGTKTTPLAGTKIQPGNAGVYRVSLPQALVDELADSDWLLISAGSVLSPTRWFAADPRMKKMESMTAVERSGGGGYCLKSRSLYFSPSNGSDPRQSSTQFRVVRDRRWFGVFRVALTLALLGAAIWRMAGAAWRHRLPLPLRERTPVVLLVGFAIFFASHQSRFVSQDARLQRVTSRFDDGYMLERLDAAARLKTMDPWELDNKAYGAVGFYPFAFFPFVCGQLGIVPSTEALNISTRGLKLLCSVGMLAAVWMLGRRHFGRAPAIAAVVLLATNLGFLGYSSYPFYPDVLMAMFSTLSLCFLLDLTARWNARSFSIAVACAAVSVSLKFLTFLLFPFIAVVAVTALWRKHRGAPRELPAAIIKNGALAAALCVAVFFLCNPYLAYNTEWIVPNYKLCGSYYSAETPNFIPGASAALSTWLNTCYRARPDSTDLIAAVIALAVFAVLGVRLLMACAAKTRPQWRWPGGAMSGAAVLLLFGVVFQLYLFRSVTLGEGIDSRLVLPLYPVLYVAAVWGVVAFIRAVDQKPASS